MNQFLQKFFKCKIYKAKRSSFNIFEHQNLIAHLWCDDYSISISACGVFGGIELGFKSLGGSFTHIHT